MTDLERSIVAIVSSASRRVFLVDWRLEDTMTVKQSVTGWVDCPASLSRLVRTKGTSTPEIFR